MMTTCSGVCAIGVRSFHGMKEVWIRRCGDIQCGYQKVDQKVMCYQLQGIIKAVHIWIYYIDAHKLMVVWIIVWIGSCKSLS